MIDPQQPIDLRPTPRNGDDTKQFALRVGIIVVAVVVLTIVYGLFTGRIAVPPETAAIIWGGVGVVLTGVFLAVSTYFQTRSARIGREEVAMQATISRAHGDANAAITRDRVAGTEDKVSTLIARVEDGLGEKFAGFVKADAEKVAEALRVKQMEDENIALKAKLDALMTVQAPAAPSAPALVLPNGQAVPEAQPVLDAIAESTASTAENTRRDVPEVQQ